ncbi:MAG: hypothetical protein ISQ19_00355 [PS1 clade bacterium]|uniref:Uncharacterized protein n=1 Tax=PS1 clade bacterium TaxID=2175152 RepID=A0A937L336_9PROT|nr:hypothetical protein [PS1 clade bacterium]
MPPVRENIGKMTASATRPRKNEISNGCNVSPSVFTNTPVKVNMTAEARSQKAARRLSTGWRTGSAFALDTLGLAF